MRAALKLNPALGFARKVAGFLGWELPQHHPAAHPSCPRPHTHKKINAYILLPHKIMVLGCCTSPGKNVTLFSLILHAEMSRTHTTSGHNATKVHLPHLLCKLDFSSGGAVPRRKPAAGFRKCIHFIRAPFLKFIQAKMKGL